MIPSAASRKSLLLVSCAFAALVGAAKAQDTIVLDAVTLQGGAAADGAGTAGEGSVADDSTLVVPRQSVTATKGAGSRLTSPQPVSVVGRDQLEERNVQSVDEATRYSSGVQGQKFGNNNRLDWFNIRGFPANEDGLYLDGLALFSTAFATWQVDPVLLDRVEILKGPASVLYGGSSPGGLVNLVSKRPTKTPQGSVEVGVNEYGQGYTALDSSGPLDQDGVFTYRLNAKLFGGDYYADEGDEFRGLIAPTFTWAPDAQTNFTVYGSYQRDDSNNVPGFLPYVGTVRPASYGKISRDLFTSDTSIDEFTRDQTMIGYEFEHSFNETFTVRQNARYAHLDTTYELAYGNGYVVPGGSDLARIHFRTSPVADTVTIDNQVEANFATGAVEHKAIAGLDYRYYELDQSQAVSPFDGPGGLGTPLDLLDPDYSTGQPALGAPYIDNTQTLNQTGLYVQDQMTVDKLVVTLNARYDFLDTELDNRIGADADEDEGAFSGRAGLAYLFDNGITPYVSYSRFFTPVLGLDPNGTPFESGDGDQYEAGIKYQPTGFDGFFTVSVFDLTRGNVLTNDVIGGNPFQQVQTGEIESKGFEFEGNVGLGNGFSLLAAYTNFDLEVTESNDIDLGNVPVAIPEQFASLWLDYAFQSDALTGLRLGGGVRWNGDSYADKANTLEVPDYTVVDASISYEKNNWKGQLTASNLFDEKAVASCQDANSCFYNEPRKLTASLKFSW
jgi:iron complex outermembrane receptor protein